jgi:hypothetical protein
MVMSGKPGVGKLKSEISKLNYIIEYKKDWK